MDFQLIVWTKLKENNQHIVKNTVRMPKVLFSRKHDINIIRMNSGTYRPWHHHSIRSQYSGFRNTRRQWTVSTQYHVIRHDNGGIKWKSLSTAITRQTYYMILSWVRMQRLNSYIMYNIKSRCELFTISCQLQHW